MAMPPKRDLTTGPVGPALLAFAVPTLMSSVLQSLQGSINAIWVGRFLGEAALAATSNANMILFLTLSFVFGFGMAATILVGQAFGRRDLDQVRRVIGTVIVSTRSHFPALIFCAAIALTAAPNAIEGIWI